METEPIITALSESYYDGYKDGVITERNHCIKMIQACIKIHKAKNKEEGVAALKYAIDMIDGGIDG